MHVTSKVTYSMFTLTSDPMPFQEIITDRPTATDGQEEGSQGKEKVTMYNGFKKQPLLPYVVRPFISCTICQLAH